MDSSVSPKDVIWFLHVCHHISTGLYRELLLLCSLCPVHFISGEQCGSHTTACLGMDVVIVRLNIESAGLGRLGIDFWLPVQLRVTGCTSAEFSLCVFSSFTCVSMLMGLYQSTEVFQLYFRSYCSPHKFIFPFCGWHWSASILSASRFHP